MLPLQTFKALWTKTMNEPTLKQALEENRLSINGYLEKVMATNPNVPQRLWEAMAYGLLTPGKRVRPFLVRESARLFDLEWSVVQPIAAAIEMVHAYSLIHDDMPCMDDSPMRHGRASVHVAFDQATALLAGNSLLTMAFEHLMAQPFEDHTKVQLVTQLCDASGAQGMMGGQQLDMMQGALVPLDEITRMQSLKTGCLLEFSCVAPALVAQANPQQLQTLKTFAHKLGLAYQITDDLLDLYGEQAVVGKPLRVDGDNSKATFVSVLGETVARQKARDLIDEAISILQSTFKDTSHLGELAAYVLGRKY